MIEVRSGSESKEVLFGREINQPGLDADRIRQRLKKETHRIAGVQRGFRDTLIRRDDFLLHVLRVQRRKRDGRQGRQARRTHGHTPGGWKP